MSSVGPFNYTVERTFVDPIYDNAKKVVNYTMDYKYKLTNKFDKSIEDTKMSVFNFDASSVWY